MKQTVRCQTKVTTFDSELRQLKSNKKPLLFLNSISSHKSILVKVIPAGYLLRSIRFQQ